MTKIFATLSVLGAVGVFSICDLCGTGAPRTTPSLVSTAVAAPAGALEAGGTPSAAAASSGPDAAVPRAVPAPEVKTVTFHVEGMTCGGCVIGVRTVLTRLNGVQKADVSYEKTRAVVTYNPEAVTITQMIAAIKTLGYTATVVAG